MATNKLCNIVDSTNNSVIQGTDLIQPSSANISDFFTQLYALPGRKPVYYCSTVNIAGTYNNTTGTLTNNGTQAQLVIDGAGQQSGNRVLLAVQTDQTQNGIYDVTIAGNSSTNWVLTRSSDFNTTGLLPYGAKVDVFLGTKNIGTTWRFESINPTIGSASMIFTQIYPQIAQYARISSVLINTGVSLSPTGSKFVPTSTSSIVSSTNGTSFSTITAGPDFTIQYNGATGRAITIEAEMVFKISTAVANSDVMVVAISVNGATPASNSYTVGQYYLGVASSFYLKAILNIPSATNGDKYTLILSDQTATRNFDLSNAHFTAIQMN